MRLATVLLSVAATLALLASSTARPMPTGAGSQYGCLVDAWGRQGCGYDCKSDQSGQVICGATPQEQCDFTPDGQVVCTRQSQRSQAEAPECRMGSDGRQACGYHCMMGADGRMACANSPDGVCAMGSNGSVACSEVASSGAVAGPPPECRMGSDGVNTCGYNCRMGSNGHFYCSSRPDAECAFNSNGTFSCP